MKIAILRDHRPESSEKWEIACRNLNLDFRVINLLKNNWLDIIEQYNPSFCVSRPPGDIQKNKKIFDEKVFSLENFTNYKIYPGYLETYIYENKAALAYFLKINNILHPVTFTSSDYEESMQYINTTTMPIIAKTLMGASGSGVKILKSRQQAETYVKRAFKSGIKRRYGPNRKTGSPKSWLTKAIKSPYYFIKKIYRYKELYNEVQKDIVLFQEYIFHPFEWRVVRIGNSFFAHKKLKIGEKASGSLLKKYDNPPLSILDFVKEITDRFGFYSQAIDIFETDRGYLVNEMQCIFGQSDPYQMLVDGSPGRYIFIDDKWLFQPGNFNTNGSYDLRLQTILESYKK